MHGGVPKRNNVLNALCHIDNLFFLTIDLKNFFGNITNTQVHQTLISRGLRWEEARIITRLTTLKGSLPQGAPTSTTLANLAFAPTTKLLEDFCKERDIIFTAFVDDLTFSSSRNFKHLVDQIIAILQNNGFFVNLKKIHYKKGCCEITGVFIKKGKLSLPKSILERVEKVEIRRYVHSVEKQYKTHLKKG